MLPPASLPWMINQSINEQDHQALLKAKDCPWAGAATATGSNNVAPSSECLSLPWMINQSINQSMNQIKNQSINQSTRPSSLAQG